MKVDRRSVPEGAKRSLSFLVSISQFTRKSKPSSKSRPPSASSGRSGTQALAFKNQGSDAAGDQAVFDRVNSLKTLR
ncbi:MAG: hypothetical protein R6V60_01530, partial [Desulfobacterales bacterium]